MAKDDKEPLAPWIKRARNFTIIGSAVIMAIVLCGYLMGGARAADATWKHAKLVWGMPALIKDVEKIKIIMEHEFGVVDENMKYHPHGRSR